MHRSLLLRTRVPAGPRSAAAACVVAVALLGPQAPAALLMNEVLYDPEGEDGGAEFVELWNSGDAPVSLESITVETGDGARPGVWTVIFTGSSADSAPPGAAYLIAGARLTGSIQNGPDAIRLARAGATIDLLGWGALADPGFYEGAPAPDVASGTSLARRLDGVDTDRNLADWEAAPSPTPGAPNHPAFGIRLAGAVALDPEVVWPGEPCVVSAPVWNIGRLPLDGSAWRVSVRARAIADGAPDGGWIDVAGGGGSALAPGETTAWSAAFVPAIGPGGFEVELVATLAAGSAGAAGDTTRARGRVGVGPIAINEIAYHDAGAGEWVELTAREDVPSWAEYALGDAGGSVRRLRILAGSGGARAGSFHVVASDPTRLLARFALPESLVLGVEGGWLALNDAAPSGSGAGGARTDVARLVDARGVPSDAAPYASTWSLRGGTLERISPRLPSASAATWTECVAREGGTPGTRNSIAAPDLDRPDALPLLAMPSRVLRRDVAGAGGLVVEVGPGAAGGATRLTVLDLRGRVRRVLADGIRFGGAGAVVWDGRDGAGNPVPSGIYVVRLDATFASGAPPRRAAVAVAVAAGASR